MIMDPVLDLQLKDHHERLNDHEQRIRALERWSAWVGGGLAVISLTYTLLSKFIH